VNSKLDTLEPEFREKVDKFLAALKSANIPVAVVCGRRTIAEQNALFAKGRKSPGPVVTNAKGGSSPHNFGLAVDICPLTSAGHCDWNAPFATWQKIGMIGKECGLIWGGEFKSLHDLPHYEDPNWRQVQAAWKRKEIEIA